EQKTVPAQSKRGQLTLVAGPEPIEHAVKIHADARMYAGLFDDDESFSQPLNSKRKQYLHLISGSLTANGQKLNAGDALLITDETELHLGHARQAEVLLFDLAA
ncbi:MAG: quercetin 2,3-dioxygenase, partial [Limnohabitans sp.]